ncbi:MAG: prepilin-type N-terminal cleavage/methylation domain-containing protein [Phycisphaerae bacterium]
MGRAAPPWVSNPHTPSPERAIQSLHHPRPTNGFPPRKQHPRTCKSHDPAPKSAKDHGLTLIETLVVIGVLALLLSILLPVLNHAREKGRAVHCAATLHNAGLAMTLYLDANQDRFWPYFEDVPATADTPGGRRWWFGFEPQGPATNPAQRNRPLDKSAGFLGPYLSASADDLRCPSFPYGEGRYFPKFTPAAGGYGYNTAALAGLNWLPALARPIRGLRAFGGRAAEVFALADGIHFDRLDYSGDAPLGQSFNEPPYIQWRPSSLFGSNVGVNGGFGHFRHNRRANVLFLDAHVAGQPVRRPLHPFSKQGYGPIANLSDESRRTDSFQIGNTNLDVDIIYGLR